LSGRDAAGRFARGYSPDRGRGFAAATSSDAFSPCLRTTVLKLANSAATVRDSEGRSRTVSLFEAITLRLATGQTSRRTSPVDFLQLVLNCAARPSVGPEKVPAEIKPALVEAKRRLDDLMLSGTEEEVEDAVTLYMRELRRPT
jgi:hypothetical protein